MPTSNPVPGTFVTNHTHTQKVTILVWVGQIHTSHSTWSFYLSWALHKPQLPLLLFIPRQTLVSVCSAHEPYTRQMTCHYIISLPDVAAWTVSLSA